MISPSLVTRRQTIIENTNYIIEQFLEKKDLCFFVGAGLSISSGLPNWSKFIGNCINASFEKYVSSDDLARIHDGHDQLWHLEAALNYAKATEGEKKRKKIIIEGIWGNNPHKISPNINHYLLVSCAYLLDAPIFTTNYDSLLFEAAEQLKIQVPKVKIRSNMKTKNLGFCILHIHGKIDRKGNTSSRQGAIVSQFDYFEEFNRLKPTLELFLKVLKKKGCVFVGTSLTDSNINRIIFEASKSSKEVRHLWFCKAKVQTEHERVLFENIWKSMRIKPIYSSANFQEVTAILRRISSGLFYKNILPNAGVTLGKKIAFQYINKLLKTRELGRCANPWDSVEVDLYEDFSTKENYSMKRIYSYNRDRRARKIGNRIYNLHWFSRDRDLEDESIVVDSMDSLYPSFIVPYVSGLSQDDSIPRCGGYLTLPIIFKQIGRSAFILVVKFRNKDNWLQANTLNGSLSKQANECILDLWHSSQKIFDPLLDQ